jgi:uncharacterized protein (DUF1684 family)
MKRARSSAVSAALLLCLPALAQSPAADFAAENAAWRKWRLERLNSETGWTTLIGLHWLKPGDNLLGSDPEARLSLPADKAPARVGVLRWAEGAVTLLPEPGVALTADGAPVGGPMRLATDRDEAATLLELGPLNFYLIGRGDRLGLRVRDREAKLRREFPGLDYFPADPRFRVTARFVPNPPGTTVPVVNVLGITEPMPSPGRVELELDGVIHSLVALDDTGDGRLFLIVGDQTNGRETYGAGRYLYADKPENGVTVVDLNRLYNPPCAFTPYSTCQLPPKENKLPRRLEVGEKRFVLPGLP